MSCWQQLLCQRRWDNFGCLQTRDAPGNFCKLRPLVRRDGMPAAAISRVTRRFFVGCRYPIAVFPWPDLVAVVSCSTFSLSCQGRIWPGGRAATRRPSISSSMVQSFDRVARNTLESRPVEAFQARPQRDDRARLADVLRRRHLHRGGGGEPMILRPHGSAGDALRLHGGQHLALASRAPRIEGTRPDGRGGAATG